MDSNNFKKIFGDFAKSSGFKSAFGGWFIENHETIIILDLQKSNYGNYFDLNIKIFIQGMLGNSYTISKSLVKSDIGDVFRRQPIEYNSIFNLDNDIEEIDRVADINKMFNNFIITFISKASNKKGLLQLAEKGDINLLPAVKKTLLE